ncbi:MAG TPA: hypothetical protein VE338_15405, partial [Ktedonobacterales bacterium]|nr:hypothetical protein [Ktedonobacterales bacterium]
AEGEAVDVAMHDGAVVRLRKLDGKHDPTDRYAAMRLLEDAHRSQELITGLIYLDESRPSLSDLERLPATPLAQLSEEQLRPSQGALDKLMSELM